MKPHIICHMLASVDGRIDGKSLRAVTPDGEYEATGNALGGDAWVCGRVTMQQHFAAHVSFAGSDAARAVPGVSVARRAESYAVSIDTRGTLLWDSDSIDGDHLIVVTSERASRAYVDYLSSKGISCVIAGTDRVDLAAAVEALGSHFGIGTLLLEGGGHVNGGFLEAGLVDEVSLLLVPGIDGRHEIASVFDGLTGENLQATPLRIKSVERRPHDVLWLRYEVVHTEGAETAINRN